MFNLTAVTFYICQFQPKLNSDTNFFQTGHMNALLNNIVDMHQKNICFQNVIEKMRKSEEFFQIDIFFVRSDSLSRVIRAAGVAGR